LRKAKGLTQRTVAQALGVESPSQVVLYEKGKRRPSRDHWAALAKVLGVTTAHLENFGSHYAPTEARADYGASTVPSLTPLQRALVEEAVKATTPLEDQPEVFLAATRGIPTEAILKHFHELLTDGDEMLRLVGTTGMGLVWRLVGIIDRHQHNREAVLGALSAALDKVDAEHSKPHTSRKHA